MAGGLTIGHVFQPKLTNHQSLFLANIFLYPEYVCLGWAKVKVNYTIIFLQYQSYGKMHK